jgi:hypothetical protein
MVRTLISCINDEDSNSSSGTNGVEPGWLGVSFGLRTC